MLVSVLFCNSYEISIFHVHELCHPVRTPSKRLTSRPRRCKLQMISRTDETEEKALATRGTTFRNFPDVSSRLIQRARRKKESAFPCRSRETEQRGGERKRKRREKEEEKVETVASTIWEMKCYGIGKV